MELFTTLWHDVKYGARLLLRTPAFTAIAVATLALGIGANTAMFSLVNAVVLRSIPIQDPKSVVVLKWSMDVKPEVHWLSFYGDTIRTPRNSGFTFSHPFLEEVEKSGIFEGVASFAGGGPTTLSGHGAAEMVMSEAVSGGFFKTLGIKPALGRLLQPSDDNPSAPPALVLDYRYWMKAFGASPDAVGKTVKLNGVLFTIVGVLEPKFVSLSFGNIRDVWYPMNLSPMLIAHFRQRNPDSQAWWALIAGRLKPRGSVSKAQAQLNVLFRNNLLHNSKPIIREQDQSQIMLMTAREALVGSANNFTDPLQLASVAVGIVLLIACANVAGLILARAARRRREIAVRLALGARRRRLLRQLLTESIILSLAGGALGIIIGFWGARIMVAMIGSGNVRQLGFEGTIDLRVLAFTAAVSILTGVLFGVAPALRSLRLDLTPTLKEASDASMGPQQRHGRWLTTGNALVVVQAALAVIVLTGAGLLVHTLTNLKNVNPGFDTRNLLTFDIRPEHADQEVPANELFERLREQIAAMPGVISVSYSFGPLLAGELSTTSFRFGPRKEVKDADWMPVSSDFFSTLKIPLFAGRNLSPADYEIATKNYEMERASGQARPGSPKPPASPAPTPIVVNQEFVKQYFPGIDPLGQHFGAENGSDEQWYKGPGWEIVGVVGNARYNDLKRAVAPTMYVPFANPDGSYEVRTAGDPKAYIASIRSMIGRVDENIPMMDPRTQSEHIESLLSEERTIAQLSSFFGILALLLACIGLYGLLSYEVTRRTREIGIRMALGAPPVDLVRMVVSQGIVLACIGTAVGIVAAIAIGHLLTKLLFGVKPRDPITLITVTALLVGVAFVAALIPARRATKVDPMVALRYE
jgi:predicted permease